MQNSLARRLTFNIMAVILVMLAIISGIVYVSVRDYMLNEAQERYQGVLQKNYEEFRRHLSDVYVAARNNVHDIERDIDHPDRLYDHMDRIVRMNPGVKSSVILFSPEYFSKNKKQFFIPIVRRDSTGRIYIPRTDGVSGYYNATWFKNSMASDSGLWAGSFFDRRRVTNKTQRTMLTTYATPVHDQEGTPVGLLCLQLANESMRNAFMKEMEYMNQKYEKGHRHQSYCFVIDRHGDYIMHPDNSRILNTSFLEQTKKTSDSLDNRVVAKMVKGENGEAMMDVDGVHSWVYYRTIKYVDWTMVIVVPKDVIFYNGRILNTIILLTMLLGLIAIYFLCRHAIKKITNPVTTQQAAIERELKIAQGIQLAMLPKALDKPHPGLDAQLDLYASLTAARDVGGDLYDYFLRDNRLFFCIGDVTGKGIPAALLMAVMRAMFRSEARRADKAADIVATMNNNLSEESSSGYFVTMFVGILDLSTGHLDYCNAGHEVPLVAGHPLPIKPNLPVGALTDWIFEGQEAQLKDGDLLFLYTDGLSEAKNTSKLSMGREHVQQLAQAHNGDTARQLVELMETEAHRYAGEAEQSDDITLLAIRWKDLGSSLTLKPTMDEIGLLKPFVIEAAQRAGISEKEAKRLRLAVEESVANIINYGEATAITLQTTISDGQLVFTIDDDGQPFNPTEGSATDLTVPADQRPPGGMGIILLQQMTDRQEYQRSNGHNILKLYKKNSKIKEV